MAKNRYDYTFNHMGRVVVMHCQEDENAAKVAFQSRYGYWPEDAIEEEPYDNS